MQYNIEELYRNEAILDMLNDRDEIYSNASIVEMVYKVTIRPLNGYTCEKYLSKDKIRDILQENDMLQDVEHAIVDHVRECFADRIIEMENKLGAL